MKSTKHGRSLHQEGAITSAIAAVHAANNAASATPMMASHTGVSRGSGSGGESKGEAVHEVIYEFAASIDTDDKGVAMGEDNVEDGVASWGDNAVGNVGVGGWGWVLNKKHATLVNGMLGK